MNFAEEKKVEKLIVQDKPTSVSGGVGIDFTDIKVESVEDADDVLSHRPKYVEQADYTKLFQQADIKSRQRVSLNSISLE